MAQLYLSGLTQAKIGEELEVSEGVVQSDLKAIQQEWLKSSLVDFNQLRAEQLAKIDNLERTYWEAWERSLQPVEEGIRNLAPTPAQLKVGNLAALQGVERCLTQRARLFGLENGETVKIKWTDNLPDNFSPSDVRGQFKAIIQMAAQRAEANQ